MSYLIEDRAFDVEGEGEEGRGTGIFRSSSYRERMDTVHRSQSTTLKMGMSEMLFSFMPGHNKRLDDSGFDSLSRKGITTNHSLPPRSGI